MDPILAEEADIFGFNVYRQSVMPTVDPCFNGAKAVETLPLLVEWGTRLPAEARKDVHPHQDNLREGLP